MIKTKEQIKINTEEFVKFIYNEDGTIKNLYNILGISSKLSSVEIDKINLCDNETIFRIGAEI